jgi:hypothetical protein
VHSFFPSPWFLSVPRRAALTFSGIRALNKADLELTANSSAIDRIAARINVQAGPVALVLRIGQYRAGRYNPRVF